MAKKQASVEYISIAYNKEEIWCCEGKSRFAMEITSKDERAGAPVLDIDYKSTVGGGVEDVYAEALAEQVTKENLDKGLIYPPFSNIRKISGHIAANVAAKAYELGLATRLPWPDILVKYAESCMYIPNYRSFR